jgi:hypothetical protein
VVICQKKSAPIVGIISLIMGFLGIKRTKVNASYQVIRCVGMQLAQNGRKNKQ